MNQSNKLISIIIPTHNSEEFIHETFNSILIQDINLEILIADGSSKDNTIEIINKYNKYLNIKIISVSDKGQSNAINKALNHVKTPYFLWLNSDDVILPNMIKEFIKFIKDNKNNKYLYISADNFDFNRSKILKYNFGSVQRKLFIHNGIWIGPFPAIIWNTELFRNLGGLREDLNYSMDFELIQRFCKVNKKKNINLHINKVLGGFRRHDKGKTSSTKLENKFKKEQYFLEKEYNISKSRKLIFKYLFKLFTFSKLIRSFFIDKQKIEEFLKLIKNTDITSFIK